MMNELMALAGQGEGRRDSADQLREAILRNKMDRLDPNVVRHFVATYIMPLTGRLQKLLLEDPESVDCLEGRCREVSASYLDSFTDQALEDSDRALDLIGHALLASNHDTNSYPAWLNARSRANVYLLSTRERLSSMAKDFIEADKNGVSESTWMWNFIDIGTIERKGSTFTLRTFFDAGRAARDYLRKQLGGPKRSVDSSVSVTVPS